MSPESRQQKNEIRDERLQMSREASHLILELQRIADLQDEINLRRDAAQQRLQEVFRSQRVSEDGGITFTLPDRSSVMRGIVGTGEEIRTTFEYTADSVVPHEDGRTMLVNREENTWTTLEKSPFFKTIVNPPQEERQRNY